MADCFAKASHVKKTASDHQGTAYSLYKPQKDAYVEIRIDATSRQRNHIPHETAAQVIHNYWNCDAKSTNARLRWEETWSVQTCGNMGQT